MGGQYPATFTSCRPSERFLRQMGLSTSASVTAPRGRSAPAIDVRIVNATTGEILRGLVLEAGHDAGASPGT